MLSFSALSNFAAAYLPRVEQTMRQALASPQLAEGTHYAMMRYHLGWLDAVSYTHLDVYKRQLHLYEARLQCSCRVSTKYTGLQSPTVINPA